MNLYSVYKFSCLCGREFQTREKGTIECPDCRRILVLEWRDDFPRSPSEPSVTGRLERDGCSNPARRSWAGVVSARREERASGMRTR